MASQLVANSMQFCTDWFGFGTETTVDDSTQTKVTLTGGDEGTGASSISSGDDTLSTSASTFTVPAGTGDVTITTGSSTEVTISGGEGDTLAFNTGGDSDATIRNSASDVVTVSGGGEKIVIVSSTVYAKDDDDDVPIDTPFYKEALLKGYSVWKCRGANEVTGFVINGANNNLNSESVKCRFVFKLSDKNFYTLEARDKGGGVVEGVPIKFNHDMSNSKNMLKNILEYGNSVGDIFRITTIPKFTKYQVSPFYALRAPSDTTAVPSIRLDLKIRMEGNQTVETDESDIFQLMSDGSPSLIRNITLNTTCVGGGEVTAYVQTFDANDNGSGWKQFSDAQDTEACKVQFKFEYKVSTVDGSDLARVDSVVVEHTYGTNVISVADDSGNFSELYTVVADYEVPLQMCYVVVRHDRLQDAEIEAYVNFMHKPKHRELVYLGRADGTRKTFTLGEHDTVSGALLSTDKNIDSSTLQIFGSWRATGDTLIENFSFNSEQSTVTFTARDTLPIYASYDYDHDVEVWRKMTPSKAEPFSDSDGKIDGTYTTRFTYALTDEEARPADDDSAKVISNVRIRLRQLKAKVKNQNLGTGNNKRQLFALEHKPKAGTIKFANADKIKVWNFNYETNILSVWAASGTPITVTYDYIGEEIIVHSVVCGWSVA